MMASRVLPRGSLLSSSLYIFHMMAKLDVFAKIVSVSVLPMLANTGAPEL